LLSIISSRSKTVTYWYNFEVVITPEAINLYLAEHIPISQALGAGVQAFDGDSIHIGAPLQPNLNHRNTAFGGSLATLGILAGWSLVNFNLREVGLPCRVVIQKSEMDFLLPVDADFEAVAKKPETWETFVKTLQRRGKARLELPSDILLNDKVVAKHLGVYVAVHPSKAP
jgi:thioesterase domain-containing protein